MRCLRKNKREFWYALYLGNEDGKDENGLYTGEHTAKYSAPKKYKANISAAKSTSIYGDVIVETFGTDIQYDKVIVIDDPDFEIDEHTVLCIDKPLTYDANGRMEYDYIVTKVARSINSVSYAIRRVTVDG